MKIEKESTIKELEELFYGEKAESQECLRYDEYSRQVLSESFEDFCEMLFSRKPD